MVGPLKAFGWITLAAKEEVFPRVVCGDAGNAGKLALIRDRDDRIAGRGADHRAERASKAGLIKQELQAAERFPTTPTPPNSWAWTIANSMPWRSASR